MTPGPEAVKHTIRWFGRITPGDPDYPDGFVPRTKHMPAGAWGWDARCSCGWETKTGGAIAARIREDIWFHRWDVANGFWPL